MENNEIMNEEIMEQAVEAVNGNSGVNFGKIGFGVLAVGAAIALGYKVVKIVKEKKAQKAQEAFEAEICDDEKDFDFEESEK